MNGFLKFGILNLILLILLGNKSEKVDYYTSEDFKSVRKFDAHIHINTTETTFVEQASKDNFQFLDIVDDRPFGLSMTDQQKLAIRHLGHFPNLMVFATTFSVKDWDSKDWEKNTLSDLKNSFAAGAIAVKIWKNIGMDLKDDTGRFVMVNDPKLNAVLNFLEENNIPVIGHNGEPKDCWLPLNKMTFGKSYFSSHPEYHMYLHPDYPTYEGQINARDSMLEDHPDLKFVGAHLGSLEWSLDELAKRLDKFPNMSVDLSRMSYLRLHALKNWKQTRDFFIEYQDRLIYATDRTVNSSANPGDLKKQIHDGWVDDWKFFVSDDKSILSDYGELRGLKLPREVINKIYYENAKRIFEF